MGKSSVRFIGGCGSFEEDISTIGLITDDRTAFEGLTRPRVSTTVKNRASPCT